MKIFERTRYPIIYSPSYWGQCNYIPEDNCGRDDVIENRNNFVEKYKITIPCHPEANKLSDVLGKKCFDHCELYKSSEGSIILVSSFYKAKSPEGFKETMSMMGFFIDNYLYHPLAETYVQEFSDDKEFENFLVLYGKEEKDAIGPHTHRQIDTLVSDLIEYAVANNLPYTADIARVLIPTLRRERCFKIKF